MQSWNLCRSRQELSNEHPVDGPATEKDEGADRPGHRAAGVGDAVSTQKQPKQGCGNKEAKSAAQQRRQKDSVGSKGKPNVKKADTKVAPKKKSAPE